MAPDPTSDIFRGPCTPILLFVFPIGLEIEYCSLFLSFHYGPALAGPFYEIGLKFLHDLLRSSTCILLLYSNEERHVLFYIHIHYLFVIKVYISFIFYDNMKNKSWYMCLIYNQPGFNSYANPLARSYSIKVHSVWQF
jgi:hypothetical protein